MDEQVQQGEVQEDAQYEDSYAPQQYVPHQGDAYAEYMTRKDDENFKKYELSNENLLSSVEHFLRNEECVDGTWKTKQRTVYYQDGSNEVKDVPAFITEEGISEVMSTLRMMGLDNNFVLNKFTEEQICRLMRRNLSSLYAYFFDNEESVIVPKTRDASTYNDALHIASKIECLLWAGLMRAQNGLTLEHVGKTSMLSEVRSYSDQQQKRGGGIFNLFNRNKNAGRGN